MSETSNREAAKSVVFVAWIYEGILPFVCKIFGWHPFLSFPTRLDAPLWWIVAGLVVLLGLVLMAAIDRVGVRTVDVRKG